jgi:hypothetical protein
MAPWSVSLACPDGTTPVNSSGQTVAQWAGAQEVSGNYPLNVTQSLNSVSIVAVNPAAGTTSTVTWTASAATACHTTQTLQSTPACPSGCTYDSSIGSCEMPATAVYVCNQGGGCPPQATLSAAEQITYQGWEQIWGYQYCITWTQTSATSWQGLLGCGAGGGMWVYLTYTCPTGTSLNTSYNPPLCV